MKKPKNFEWAQIGEMTSLTISTILIVFLVGFLIKETSKPNTPYLSVAINKGREQSMGPDVPGILPVTIKNQGQRTISLLKIQVQMGNNIQTIEIDYLGGDAERVLYLYLDKGLTGDKVDLKPIYYELE